MMWSVSEKYKTATWGRSVPDLIADVQWSTGRAAVRLTPHPATWDQATPHGVNYKAIHLGFLANMSGDICNEKHVDAWGTHHGCIRLPGHTGRHLATNYNTDYPTAVWS